MWVLKLKLDSRDQFLGRMALKHGVSLAGYPLSCAHSGRHLKVLVCGVMVGSEAAKTAAIEDIARQPECLRIERKGDFVVMLTRQPLFTSPVYDPLIFRPVPVVINPKERKHTWVLASFDKARLDRVFAFAKKRFDARIVFFREETLSSVSVLRFNPVLTKKQKVVLEAAINAGYYEYPRKTTLERLARSLKLSYSTVQAHMRKAEGRLIPSLYREM